MSDKRRINRAQERIMQEHTSRLANHLATFYEYLSKKGKPSDEELREEFDRHKEKWYQYCDSHKLTEKSKDLFVLNVEAHWKHKAALKTTN